MPIKTRKIFQETSRYIRYDPATNSYDYKTPSDVVRWPQTFRERIIRDWEPPYPSGVNSERYSAYARLMEKETWKIRNQRIFIRVKHFRKSIDRFVPLTFVLSSQHPKSLLLDHHNSIIRSLMVYSFLKDEAIGGLPAPKFLDKHILLSLDIGRSP